MEGQALRRVSSYCPGKVPSLFYEYCRQSGGILVPKAACQCAECVVFVGWVPRLIVSRGCQLLANNRRTAVSSLLT